MEARWIKSKDFDNKQYCFIEYSNDYLICEVEKDFDNDKYMWFIKYKGENIHKGREYCMPIAKRVCELFCKVLFYKQTTIFLNMDLMEVKK